MRWPIRNQILLPVTAILIVAMVSTASSSAFLAAKHSEQATSDQLNRVVETLGQSDFPYSAGVLDKMKGLSGAEFVAFDDSGHAFATTLSASAGGELSQLPDVPLKTGSNSPADFPVVEIGSARFFAFRFERTNPLGREEQILVLYPEASLELARRQAAVPPLAIGGVTLLAMVVISVWMAGRIGRRIRTIQEHVAKIADGDFREVGQSGRDDEIADLVGSINSMTQRLNQMRETLRQAERAGLLGQLAGGLAHQLRNAITGARLAVQIHQRRCGSTDPDESLDVALKQLSLTEEQIKGLLSLGKTEERRFVSMPLAELVDDIASLVFPVCDHSHVSFTRTIDDPHGLTVGDSESIRTAVLNLILNAIEAAGVRGVVSLDTKATDNVVEFTVIDSGAGPPPELASRLTDAFVTGKPEGVGLGLAMVQQVADDSAGELKWERIDDTTVFRLKLTNRPPEPLETAASTVVDSVPSDPQTPQSAIAT